MVVRTPEEQRFPQNELFHCLINETNRTFKEGIIVSASVMRVFEARDDKPGKIICRLENGLDANIGEQDADFFNQDRVSIEQGSIITGRVAKIMFGDKTENVDQFSVILKCKQSDLRRHDTYIE